MTVVLSILAAFVAYIFIGCGFMAWMDLPGRYDGRLLKWFRTDPTGGFLFLLWPWFFWKAYIDMKANRTIDS